MSHIHRSAAVLDALKKAKQRVVVTMSRDWLVLIERENPSATLTDVQKMRSDEANQIDLSSILERIDEKMSVRQFDELLKILHEGRKRAQSRAEQDAMRKANVRLPYHRQVSRVYNSQILSGIFAACIMVNFALNILEMEIDPTGETYVGSWKALDNFFTIVFLVELVMNMYTCGGPHRRLFRCSAWNMFDTLVVVVGIILMSGADLGSLEHIKLLRAFRVLRLGSRIKSLNKIMVALIRCIPGVLSALVLMLLFFALYAIIAVDMFRKFGDGGTYKTWNEYGNMTEISAVTSRGYWYGREYFGTFSKAMMTLYQVMTGESWAEAVVRPLLFGLYRDDALFVSVYFVSFRLLLDLVMGNIVVAVLLDKFAMDTEESKSNTKIVDDTELSPDSRDVRNGQPSATEMFQIGQEEVRDRVAEAATVAAGREEVEGKVAAKAVVATEGAMEGATVGEVMEGAMAAAMEVEVTGEEMVEERAAAIIDSTIDSTIGKGLSLHAKLDQLLQQMKNLHEQMEAFGQPPRLVDP